MSVEKPPENPPSSSLEHPAGVGQEEELRSEDVLRDIERVADKVQEELKKPDIPERRQQELRLSLKVFEGAKALVHSGDKARLKHFAEAQRLKQSYRGIVGGDILYLRSGDKLVVGGVNGEEKTLDVMLVEQGEEPEKMTIRVNDLLDTEADIVAVDKISGHIPLSGEVSPPSQESTIPVQESVADKANSLDSMEGVPDAKEAVTSAPTVERKTIEPKPLVPKWRAFSERVPRTHAERLVLAQRKERLTNYFNADGSDGSLWRWVKAGLQSSPAGKRLEATYREFLNQDPPIDEMYYLGGESLQDLLDKAHGPDLKTLKFISLSLLANNKEKNGEEHWQRMEEDQRFLTRVGELIGLEVERRQLIDQFQEGKEPNKEMVRRACARYTLYSRSPDIPDVFRERFTKTAERWAREYNISLVSERRQVSGPRIKPEAQGPPKAVWLIERGKERVASMAEAYKNHRVEDGIEQLTSLKQQLMESSPAVREMEQNIYEEQFNYPDSFLVALKDRPPMSAKPENEVYRKNFIDSMYQQIRHSQFVNSKPSLFNRVVRGVVEKWDARIQVVGFWKATFRWKWTREKMQEARNDVISSLQNVAGVGFDPDMAAYHVAELGMANLHERKASITPQPIAEQPRYTTQDARDYAYGNNEQNQSDQNAQPETIKMETTEKERSRLFSEQLVRRWEKDSTLPTTMQIYEDIEPDVWEKLKEIAQENNVTPEQYVQQVQDAIARRVEEWKRAA